MTKSTEATTERRRIWSDPFFYATLGVIAATYILLIVTMLLADATYLFTSDMRDEGLINFETYEQDGRSELLEPGQTITDQYANFGLTVSAVRGERTLWPTILDSGEPSERLAPLGTPNVDFEGPGEGAGGGRSAPIRERNNIRLRNVLVISDDEQRVRPAPDGGRLRFDWSDPVRVDRVRLLNVTRPGGLVTAFGQNGQILSRKIIAPTGPNGVSIVDLLQSNAGEDKYESLVRRLEVHLPNASAVSELRFKWHGHLPTAWEKENPGLARVLRNPMTVALGEPAIQYSIKLSLISCTITAILSLWVAVPIGYLLSRHRFFGCNLLDAVLDIPIVLPPLVVGLSLLILFQFVPRWLHDAVVYQLPAVILAQFAVACAFAVRTMRATFDQIDARREQVALTLGCSRFQAFGMIVVPEAGRGIVTAGTLAWARALGEFGPLLIFAGATRYKTEVLSTTVFLEMTVGDLGGAVAVSLIMVAGAVTVLMIARLWGTRNPSL